MNNKIIKITYFLIIMTLSNLTQANIEISQYETKNGIKVLYTKAQNIPMIDIKITFDAGSNKDGDIKGLSMLTHSLLDEGTSKMNSESIASTFESTGAIFNTSVNKDKSLVQKSVNTNTKLKSNKKPVKTKSNVKKRQNGDNLNIIKAPDFNLADLDGNVINFSAYEGQVIMLTFWGTWCGPCRQEIPDFIELYDKYNDKGLEIVGIAIQSGSAENIKRFSEYYKINYPILTDINGNESYKAFSDYGLISGVGTRAVPTTFLIDRDGNIVKTYRGARPGHVFLKDIELYL